MAQWRRRPRASGMKLPAGATARRARRRRMLQDMALRIRKSRTKDPPNGIAARPDKKTIEQPPAPRKLIENRP